MSALLLPPTLHAQIVRHTLDLLPRECCGLLEGTRQDDMLVATAVRPMANLAARDDRFALDPADHLRFARRAREAGRAIIGCYHSHPHGVAAPSPQDLAGAGEAGFAWLIAAPERGAAVTLAAYAFDGSGFLPLRLIAEASLDPAAGLRV